MQQRKSAKNDLERRRPTFLKIGLIASLAFALMAFEYTTYGPDLSYHGDPDLTFIDEELPPLPKRKERVKQEKEKVKDPNKFKVVQVLPEPDPDPDPKPDPKPDPDPVLFSLDTMDEGFDVDTISIEPFIKVEKMPHFKVCSEIVNDTDRAKCTEIGFIQHLNAHLRVPRDIMISEKAYVYFVIGTRGKVIDLKMLNKVTPSLEREIRRVFEIMPALIPGEQRNKKVPVQYNIPVSITIR